MMAMDNVLKLFQTYDEAFRLAYSGFSYHELRAIHKEFNSIIDANAIYDAKKLLKVVLKTHNYPKKLNPKPLLRKQDFRITGNKCSIIFKPGERLELKVFPSEKQLKLMAGANPKGARLVERNGKYFLNLVLKKEVAFQKEFETVIGVDIGINYIAVCSALTKDGRFKNPLFFKGGEWRHLCDRKRKTTRIEEFNRLTRRQHEILHTVSKRIAEYAKRFPKPVIVLERFGHFQNNSKNRRFNFLLGNWARKKLQKIIEYKANWEGIQVVYVNPAYTSLTCHYCGAKGKRNGLVFTCPTCNRQYNADSNAAMSLAKKFRQLLDEPEAVTGERSAVDLSSTVEGKAYLPRQTCIRHGNQMNGMMVTRTVRLPLGAGGG